MSWTTQMRTRNSLEFGSQCQLRASQSTACSYTSFSNAAETMMIWSWGPAPNQNPHTWVQWERTIWRPLSQRQTMPWTCHIWMLQSNRTCILIIIRKETKTRSILHLEWAKRLLIQHLTLSKLIIKMTIYNGVTIIGNERCHLPTQHTSRNFTRKDRHHQF